VRRAIVFETRQRQADARLRPLRHAREQKSLLVARQQHIELPRSQKLLDKGQIAVRVFPQSRAMVECSDEAGEARDAIAAGVADLDDVALSPSIVSGSRPEVEEPSDKSTRSCLFASVMPDHRPGSRTCLVDLTEHLPLPLPVAGAAMLRYS
jgi:hypothetical protein